MLSLERVVGRSELKLPSLFFLFAVSQSILSNEKADAISRKILFSDLCFDNFLAFGRRSRNGSAFEEQDVW